MVPLSHQLAQVEGAMNAVYIEGDLVGPVLLVGQGAGGAPTASAVVGDLIEVARSIGRQVQARPQFTFDDQVAVVPMSEVSTRAYLRCRVADRPGVLSLKGASMPVLPFVVTTHPAPDAALERTRRRIAELDVVHQVSTFLRVL